MSSKQKEKNTKPAEKQQGKKNTKEKKQQRAKVPKTVQQSIPYDSVYPNGIFQRGQRTFCKSYRLEDANFSTANQGDQENMYLDYEGLLNSLDENMTGKVTIYNRSIAQDDIKRRIFLKPQNDDLNVFRNEYNGMLGDKMAEGRNNLVKEKYFTASVEANGIEEAVTQFRRIDSDVTSKVNRINKKDVEPMSVDERLGVLYDIYNDNTEFPFSKKIEGLMKNGKLNLDVLNGSGLCTKDLIGPESMSFKANYFMLGERYCRALYLDNLPTFLNAEVLNNLTDIPCNMVTTVVYRPIPTDKASTMVKHQITNINENIVRQQKKAAQNNYSADILPSELKRAQKEAEALREDMQSRNQKLFKVSVLIVIMAGTMDELNQHTESLKSVGVAHLAQVKTLSWQQELAFNSALPLGCFDIKVDRVLNTEAAAVFMPFSVQELSQEHGVYYGLNAISHNLIMYDRLSADNYNGLIFGKPGSGKSFIAKSEIITTLLGSPDDIYVIDPEGEYKSLADSFGGEVVRIAIGSDTHINPLDMDVNYAGGQEDPIAMKCDFLTTICETILGHGNLDPIMINIIHKCGKRIYKPYYEHMRTMVNKRDKNGNRITCDYLASPTLVDFYQALMEEPDQRAQILASSIEMYCIGNYDLFAKQTDIDPKSRFVIYDIKDIGAGMKELALQICLNDIWNRIIQNKKLGKRTWFYIDEFYLLTQTKSSAQFIQQIYKRARKWGGIPTGITQNVEDLLTSEDARTILNNCNFLLMMNQSQIDRAALSDLYSISETLQDYITDKPAGTGLMYTGTTIIPFVNQFPKDTQLYKIMSTKVTEKDDDDGRIMI